MTSATLTDVTTQMPSFGDAWSVLTLSAGYNASVVVIGSTFLGIAAGVTGTFALLRKRAMMGDALAHAALPGIAAAFLIASSIGWDAKSLPLLLLGAACSGVLGVLLVQLISQDTRLSEDTAIGVVLSVFFGAGIALLSVIQDLGTGDEGGLATFIYGQTAALSKQDATLMCVLALFAIICTSLLTKEFRLTCFDADYAATQGWPTNFLDLAMMSLIVLVTIIGLQSVGIILIIALLIVPATAARFWSERLRTVTLLAGLFGGLSGYFGSCASALLPRLPAGSVIVLTAGVFFLLSFLIAPERGVTSAWLRRKKLKASIVREHILREIIEFLGENATEKSHFQTLDIPLLQKMSPRSRLSEIDKLVRNKFLIRESASELSLSTMGLELATKVTRKHRLWEIYLLTFGHLPSSHVDESADIAEHALSDETISILEGELIEAGALEKQGVIPESTHPLNEQT